MRVPIPLSEQPTGYLLLRAAELRAMAKTARTHDVAASLVRIAVRFEALDEARIIPPDN